MIRILDRLKPTATGLDGLPAWFMRLGATVFIKPLADLINLSISSSTVPTQWKRARICPVPKTANPKQPSDFRAISASLPSCLASPRRSLCVTSYTRRLTVPQRRCASRTSTLNFRPSCSTTAALVVLLNSVTQALENNPYVVVVALDFSKAFDTVRHSSAMAKVAQLQLPDCVHNTG